MILSDDVIATRCPTHTESTLTVHTSGPHYRSRPKGVALCHPPRWNATNQKREGVRCSVTAAPKLLQHGHSVREKLYTAGGTRYSRCTLGDQESSPPTPMCAWSRCR